MHEVLASTIALAGVTLRRNTIGLCSRDPGRLRGSIRFEDNDDDVQAVELYVPEPPTLDEGGT